ncbi:MAG: cupin domain-containing protein [Chthoniobacterales bacterium]
MKKVNTRDIAEYAWKSPKGKFRGAGQGLSEALGREMNSTDLMKRHPFDVEITRLPANSLPYPYHSHSAQWEFYYVMSGRGSVRDQEGTTAIEAGDSFLFPPDQPHQLINDSDDDLVILVVADNPIGESCHYPDSNKWVVRSPERRLMRGEALDYFDGEE